MWRAGRAILTNDIIGLVICPLYCFQQAKKNL